MIRVNIPLIFDRMRCVTVGWFPVAFHVHSGVVAFENTIVCSIFCHFLVRWCRRQSLNSSDRHAHWAVLCLYFSVPRDWLHRSPAMTSLVPPLSERNPDHVRSQSFKTLLFHRLATYIRCYTCGVVIIIDTSCFSDLISNHTMAHYHAYDLGVELYYCAGTNHRYGILPRDTRPTLKAYTLALARFTESRDRSTWLSSGVT